MKQITLAIIGAGEIAQNFHLPILHRLPNVKIAALCDKNKTKATLVAEKYEIPFVTTEVSELLDFEEITAVDICASTDAHAEIALEVIEKQKHAFIEKPIARNYTEALAIHEAAVKNNVKVQIGTNQRFRYDAKMLKNFVQTGELGEVIYVRGSWQQQKRGAEWKSLIERSGGGVLLDLGISLIDSLLWICDFPEVKSVSSAMYMQDNNQVEDVFIGNIRFANSKFAVLESSWSLLGARRNFAFSVYGTKGSAKVNPLELYKKIGEPITPFSNYENLSNFAIHRKSFESELKHFINGLLGYNPIISTTQEAVLTMKIVDAMYQSAREQREIEL